ncbi:hypothetical protein GI374_10590 [Paracoccus sp. S-4012]|uniref:site-specific integrase n=1 Tax=Paracoccus sp. S-4012 TaxID=2665648 RepID=UPI0012AF2E48|nr:site-specific integrase [Paracoccus sp. S-4012]MRX50886.1 hypothetical protein [Paracoccus sp. S-4012]
MFDRIIKNDLTPDEARAWLRHVVTEELTRIQGNRAILLADGGADSRVDWPHGEAWRILARNGPGARLTAAERNRLQAEGRDDDDLENLDVVLTMLRRDLRSESRRLRIGRAFRELIGTDHELGAVAFLALRKLFADGKAAAWTAAPPDQGLDVAIELASSIADEMTKRGRAVWLTPEPSEQPRPRATETVSPEPPVVEPARTEATSVPECAPATEETQYDPSIPSVIARLVEQKRREHVSPVTLRQYETFSELFSTITGVTDTRAIRQSHAARFRDVLQQMPKSWGKSPRDRGVSVQEMLRRAESLPRHQVGLSVGTINRHLEHLALMLSFAADLGIAVNEKVNPGKLRLKDSVRDRDKRASSRVDELKQLFQHTVWQGCRSLSRRNHPRAVVIRDGLYWVPVLAAFTGARREELAALSAADVKEEGGITFIHITENANRGLKTLASDRQVPLHRRLIELGFLEHVRKSRGGDLFPELRPKRRDESEPGNKKFGDRLWYAFDQALSKSLDGNPRNLSLHSMRHYVKDQLEFHTTIPARVRLDLMGHEGNDLHSRVYGDPSPLSELKAAIEKLPVVI